MSQSLPFAPLQPVIAVLGQPAQQELLRACFDDQFHVLTFENANEFSKALEDQSVSEDEEGCKGILQVDWIQEHQSGYPSVAVLAISREDAAGGPSSWASLVSSLSTLTAACKPRGIYIVIVVLADFPGSADLPEDRATMVCRHAGIERSRLLQCAFGNSTQSEKGQNTTAFRSEDKRRLKDVVSMEASRHYSADSQRRISKIDSSKSQSVTARLGRDIKLAALAEMRNDWESAERFYLAAYGLIPQAAGTRLDGLDKSRDGRESPVQWFLELRAVAGLITFRVMGLLIQVMTAPSRAVDHLRHHLATFRTMKNPGDSWSEMVANQAGWVSGQLCMAAQLLSNIDPTLLSASARPARLYLDAAHAAMERRTYLQSDPASQSQILQNAVKKPLLPGQYIGTYTLPGELTVGDDQVVAFLHAEESCVDHRAFIISLLRKSIAAEMRDEGETESKSLQPTSRIVLMAKRELGRELMGTTHGNANASDLEESGRLLLDVAQGYRAEGWYDILLPVLIDLQTNAVQRNDQIDKAMLSLEIAYINNDEEAAVTALNALKGHHNQTLESTNFEVVTRLTPCHPWTHMLPIAYGFSPVQPDAQLDSSPEFVVAVRNRLPMNVRLHRVEVGFHNGEQDFVASPAVLECYDKKPVGGVDKELVLIPGAWVVCRAQVPLAVMQSCSRMIAVSYIDLHWRRPSWKLRYGIPSPDNVEFPNYWCGLLDVNDQEVSSLEKMTARVVQNPVEWGCAHMDLPLHRDSPVSLKVSGRCLGDDSCRSLLVGEHVPLDVELVFQSPLPTGKQIRSVETCRVTIDASSSTCDLSLSVDNKDSHHRVGYTVLNTDPAVPGQLQVSISNPTLVVNSASLGVTVVQLGRYLCTLSSPGEFNISVQAHWSALFESEGEEVTREVASRATWSKGGIAVHRAFSVEFDISSASTEVVGGSDGVMGAAAMVGEESLLGDWNNSAVGGSELLDGMPVVQLSSGCPVFLNLRITSQTDTPIVIRNTSLVWDGGEDGVIDVQSSGAALEQESILATKESSCCAAFLLSCGNGARVEQGIRLHPKAHIEWSRTEVKEHDDHHLRNTTPVLRLPTLRVTTPTWRARPKFEPFATIGVLTRLIIELESTESAIDLDIRIGPSHHHAADNSDGSRVTTLSESTPPRHGHEKAKERTIDFLIAGPTSTTVSLAPHDSPRSLSYGLIPLKVGHLPLPMVTVCASRGVAPKSQLHVTQGCLLFVHHDETVNGVVQTR